MLPAELKREISYGKFKTQINNWFGAKRNCNACKYVENLSAALPHHDFHKPKSKESCKNIHLFNPFSANLTKWSNTLKQFVGKLPTNYLSVFDHFVGLSHKG